MASQTKPNYDDIVKSARSENEAAVTFDMRKFLDQTDALETWLQNTGIGVQMGVLKHTKPIILLCDTDAVISAWAKHMLGSLQSQGVRVEIQPAGANPPKLGG